MGKDLMVHQCPENVLKLGVFDEKRCDVRGWLCQEKLDGVRGLFDGTGFVGGAEGYYAAPGWFLERLITLGKALDGELHAGRGNFNKVSGVVRRLDGEGWESLRFTVFDCPTATGAYEDRLKEASRVVEGLECPWIDVVTSRVLERNEDVPVLLREVESLGGEGLVLRDPSALWEPGRSSRALKVKGYKDCEATVLSHQAGRGKHLGLMGSLVCRCHETGAEFRVGTGFDGDQRRRASDIFPAGTVVTFRYFERFESGKPRHPSFLRVRPDRNDRKEYYTCGTEDEKR